MALELLFTSATQGLKPGSQGYCTVQCTQAMPGPLAERLEALSAYRPVYPSQSEQAKLNPVNVAYWRIRLMGKTFPVLSRIADYGLDYSNRTNKIAHHLVIDSSELNEAGPAAIASSGTALLTEWNQKVESIAQPRRLPAVSSKTGVCRHWQKLMGDAGWAGVVAEEILKDQKQPIFLIFEPGQEMLPLIVEVQSLLPANLRWKSTFSTYLTYLPPEAECQIRCLLKGSKEAHESLRHVNALRIDLTQPKPAPAGAMAEAARTGLLPVRTKKPEHDASYDFELDDAPPALPGKRAVAAEPLQLQIDESGRKPGSRGRRKNYNAAPVLPQKSGKTLYIAGGVIGGLLCVIVAVVMLQVMKEKPKDKLGRVIISKMIPESRLPESSVTSTPQASVVSESVGSNLVEPPEGQAPLMTGASKNDEMTTTPNEEQVANNDGQSSEKKVEEMTSDGKSTIKNGENEKQSLSPNAPKILYLADFDAIWKPSDSTKPALPLIAESDTIRDVQLKVPRLIYPEELLPKNVGFDVIAVKDGFLVKSVQKSNEDVQLSSAPLFEITAASGLPYFVWKKGFNTSYNTPAILAFSVIELNADSKTYLSLHTKRQASLTATSGISPHPTALWLGKKVNDHVIPKESIWLPLADNEFEAKEMNISFKGVHEVSTALSLEKATAKLDRIEFEFQSENQILVDPVSTPEFKSNIPDKPVEQLNAFSSQPLGPVKFVVKLWLDKVELDFKYDRVHQELKNAQSMLEAASKSNEQDSEAFRNAKNAAKTTVEEYIKKLKNIEDVPVSITGRIEYSLEDVERDIMIPVVLVEFVKEPKQ